LILLFLLFFLVSCGNLTTTKSVVQLDSKPRGLYVYDHEKKFVGRSPIFLEVDKGFHYQFHYSVKKDGPLKKMRRHCRVNWLGSVLPNSIFLPFFPAGTAMGASFLGTDLINGGLNDCTEKFILKSKNGAGKIARPLAQRLLILPPEHYDGVVSNSLARHFKKNIFQKFRVNPTDQVVSFNQTSSDLRFFGIDHDNAKDLKIMRDEIYLYLAQKYQVTGFVKITYKDGVMYSQVIDAFTKKYTPSVYNKKVKLTIKGIKKRSSIIQFLVKSISLLPNAATVTKTEGAATFKVGPGRGEVNEDRRSHPDAFPKWASSFGIETIRPTFFYGMWDADVWISPAMGLSSFQYKTDVQGHGNLVVNFSSLNLFMMGNVALFTPFGALQLGAGIGGSYFEGRDNKGGEFKKGSTLYRILISHYFFWSRRVYSTINFSSNHFGSNPPSGTLYEMDHFNEASIGLGMYFPEAKSLTRAFFK